MGARAVECGASSQGRGLKLGRGAGRWACAGVGGVQEVIVGSPRLPPNPPIPSWSLPFDSPVAPGTSAGQLVFNLSKSRYGAGRTQVTEGCCHLIA